LFIPYFHAAAVQQTVEWLDKNGIPYWDLCFMKEKDQVGADVYIEDNPDNIMKLRAAGLATICFANSSNKHIGPPRGADWAEIYQLIKKL
jgi:5'(3')-deoxyribonucleotidase